VKQSRNGPRQVFRVTGVEQQAIQTIRDGLRDPADSRRDDGDPCQEGFLDHERAVLGPD
jgi:hypothetical protein